MPINTTLYQTSPYYDDYVSSGNEAKGHLKILFKPGVSVQVRELNQLQTLLQTQIDRLGSNLFENGSRVLDGEVVFDPSLYFIDIVLSDVGLVVSGTSPSAADVDARIKTYLKKIDEDGGLSADVISAEALVANDTETTYRLFLRYTKKTDAETFFSRLQNIRSKQSIKDNNNTSSEVTSTDDVIGEIQKVGFATKLRVNKGVFFVGGYFVNVEATDVFIERPSENTRLTGKLAFKVSETVTNSVSDTTLVDNSTGTPNASAPGADRYAITLSLVLLTDQNTILNVDFNANKVFNLTTSASSTDFVSLVTIEDNRVIRPLSAQYADGAERLGGVIAKRTFEESGNYTLNPFIIDVREAYNDGGNRGRFSATETSDINTLKSKYAMGIEPSTAYVEGYRVELKNRIEILADKARDQEFDEAVSVNSGEPTYIEGKFTDGTIPDIEGDNSPLSSYVVQGSGSKTITPTGIEKIRGTGLNTVFRLYFNLGTASYKQVNAATNILDQSVSPQVQFNPTEATFKVKGNKKSSKIIPLPRKVVSAVNDDETTFVIRKEFTGADTAQLTKTNTTTIVLKGISAATQTFFRKDVNDYIVSDGTTFKEVSAVSFNAAFTEVTLTLSSATSAAVGSISAIASVRTKLTLSTKTLVSASVTNAPSPKGLSTGEVIQLGVSDIVEITSIVAGDDNSPEQTIKLSDFVLDNGQRDDSYQNGTLTYVGDGLTGNVTISFTHFTHSGSGTYFTRESYPTTFDYAKIPVYKGNRLSDVLDFRGTNGSELDPNTQINLKLDYFLPRYDQLILTRRGEFLINKGVSSLEPTLPELPKGSLLLYNLFLPAFTFDAKAIDTEYFDHRRYTMRDIGNLEKRIKNIEYYTSLSLLEQEAKDKKIFDGSGERFKNGIFVDSFTGHNRGAVTDPGYKCSIDYLKGQLHPSFDINDVEVRVDGTSDDNFVRLPTVATETIIDQKFAAVHESVIPYGTSNYRGTLQLSPCGDSWYEVNRRPDLTNNPDGNYDNIEQGSDKEKTNGSVWNVAQVNWMGWYLGGVLARSEKYNKAQRAGSTTPADYITQTETDRVREKRSGDSNDASVRVTTSKDAIREKTSGNIITEREDGKLVETTLIPFIRSRRVYFKAMGMKPNTRLYAYFDETNVTGYATTLASGNFEDFLNRKVLSAARVDFYDKNASESFALVSDSRRDLTTDANGTIQGYFIIPNNTESRFATGQRIFTLSDTNNGVNDPLVTTRARAKYVVSPGFDLEDCNLNETRLPEVSDPDNTNYPVEFTPNTPDGVPQYALATDKFNVEEGESFTVTLTTENVANGTNVPYTITGVTTSDLSGATGTSLTGNFTVQSNTASITFKARVDSETDEADLFLLKLTNNPEHRVSVSIDDALFEPFDGDVRFLVGDPNQAANPSTYATGNWSPFEFCREDPLAQSFQLSDVGIPQGALIKSIDIFFQAKNDDVPVTIQIVEVENGFPTQRLVKHGVKTIPSSSVTTSTDASTATNFAFHSPVYLEADREYAFIVRSSSADYRIWLSEIDNTDVLTGERISRDPYLGVAFRSANASTWTPVQTRDIKFKLNAHTFLSSTETTRTRAVGPGTVTETGTGNFQSIIKNGPFNVDSVQFSPGQLILPRTSIEYKLVVGGRRYDLKPDGSHMYLPSTVSVSSASDIKLEANLTTNDEYLSPLIDFDRICLVCNGNIINNDVTNETNAAHGNATARYITKKVVLNNPADKLNVYIGAFRPEVANIEVYARFDDEVGSPQTLDLNDAPYTLVPSVPISETADENTLQEIEYEIDPTNDFSQFQLKIVMTSTNAAKTPIINDLRAIASI